MRGVRGGAGWGLLGLAFKAYMHPCRARGGLAGKVKGWGLLELAEKASCKNSKLLKVKGVSGPKVHSIVAGGRWCGVGTSLGSR